MTTMQTINIPTFQDIKLISFRPLCMNELGQRAIRNNNFQSFIDASCRREPDFENPFPSISALCRKSKFAPRLKPDDIIVYITVAGHYQPYTEIHHRLVAILQVEEIYKTHPIGQIEYNKLNLPTPRNCMVSDNPPVNFDQTAGNFRTKKGNYSVRELNHFLKKPPQMQQLNGQRRLQYWDNDYFKRAAEHTCFVRTRNIYSNLTDPTPIFRKDFEFIFRKVPNTQLPKKISELQFILLAKLAGLDISLGQQK